MTNRLDDTTPDAINEAGPKALVTPIDPLNINTYTGGDDMSHSGQYTDSANAGNPEHNENGGRS